MATDDDERADERWYRGIDDDDGPFDDEDRDCYWCGGDGWGECSDPIQCTSPHNAYGECQCSSCGGSGLAKDMTIW